MPLLRFAASALVTLVLLGLVALLSPLAFDLSVTSPDGGIGPGALPQFVVICTAILAVAIFVTDVVHRRRGTRPKDETDAEDLPGEQVLRTGIPVLLLLAAFIAAWHYLNFLVTSIAFTTALSILIAGPKGRSPRGLAVASAVSVLFCTGVWSLFVHGLNVPLR